jgi:glycosyltransferase involved in cell wall biosynthesis
VKIDSSSSILILGQHLTSRTEAVRDYLLAKAAEVYVIGIGSFAVNKKENHAFSFRNGALEKHRVFTHRILKYLKSRAPLISMTFLLYCVDIVRSLMMFGKRFDVYIGISQFSGIIGVLLKKARLCKKFVYYTIDYYVPHRKEDCSNPFLGCSRFDTFLLKLSILIDSLAVSSADEVWDISPRIEEARIAYGGGKGYGKKKKIVPLGYDAGFFRCQESADIDRFSVVFVGVTLASQGLELILDIIPELSSVIPEVTVKVVGRGPFLPQFKEMVAARGLSKYFKFYGFIEDVDEMLEVVAKSAVGVSVWDDRNNRILNAYYGDPGKTKLYSVCGLPVVVSDITVYAGIVSRYNSGVAIQYDSRQLLEALKRILADENAYLEFKKNAVRTAREYCASGKLFDAAFNER